MKRPFVLVMTFAAASLLAVIGCSDDDDNNPIDPPAATPAWEGTWLSAGADVAPLLSQFFAIDSVRVTFNENQTIALAQHDTTTKTWTNNSGTYAVTESSSGTIHSVAISYTGTPSFDQEGIIEVTDGTPDRMKLEVVQTVPDIGATPLTPAQGFGADPTLGTINIQNYVRID
ncbi:MAG: hypothetical protein R3E97_00500 [Candidatus Eisenbacteria bacterium]